MPILFVGFGLIVRPSSPPTSHHHALIHLTDTVGGQASNESVRRTLLLKTSIFDFRFRDKRP